MRITTALWLPLCLLFAWNLNCGPTKNTPDASENASEKIQEATSETSTKEPTQDTNEPAVEPAKEPTKEPSKEPLKEPTAEPTKEPTKEPNVEPAKESTKEPIEEPGPPERPKETNTPDEPGIQEATTEPTLDASGPPEQAPESREQPPEPTKETPISCPSGQLLCNGVCVPSDNQNCGTCSNVCSSGKTCQSGTCKCPPSNIICNDVCTPSDNQNCGTCGNVCQSPTTCNTSTGVCGCPPGEFVCNGACVPSSNQNCGACGKACATGQVCETFNGTCTTPCSPACQPDTAYCSNGQCLAKCPSHTERWCDGKCVSIQNNDRYCGSCISRCKLTSSCDGVTCIDHGCDYLGDRKSMYMTCHASPTQGVYDWFCSDRGDWYTCGTCPGQGQRCLSTQHCNNGSCVSSCPSGKSLCLASGAPYGSCYDLQTDREHCGTCTTKCTDAQVCTAGMCVTHPCPTGQTAFKGSCVNLNTNPLHCGSLKNSCYHGQECVNGTCKEKASP